MDRKRSIVFTLVFFASTFSSIHMKSLVSPSSMSVKSWPPMKVHDIWNIESKSLENNRNSNSEKENNEIYFKNSSRSSKVLDFLSVPNEDECLSDDSLHSGVCMNVYECRLQGGKAKGDCALGFGVCCVFIVTCNEEIKNNITYFVSANFPALLPQDVTNCHIKINPVSPDISQIRLDFMHFLLGQPNRRTGVCDGDVFRLFGGGNIQEEFILCGQNTGQHVYYDLNPTARSGVVELAMNFTKYSFASRLWQIKITQVPFSQRAPHGCLQYFTEPSGILQTFNFAENGRHLANQNYKICFKQESGMCSIAYEPCNEQSFRIGPSQSSFNDGPTGQLPGQASSVLGSDLTPLEVSADSPAGGGVSGDLQAADASNVATLADAPSDTSNDITEGSGAGADEINETEGGNLFPSLDSIRDIFFSFRSMRNVKNRQDRQLFSTCTDRITMPCIIEDFMSVGMSNTSTSSCVPVHCGLSLCTAGTSPCRLESSVAPFRLGIRFGDGRGKGSPEDNIGACLKFNQLPCAR